MNITEHFGMNIAALLSADSEGYCCRLAAVQSSLPCRCLRLHRNAVMLKTDPPHFSYHSREKELSKAQCNTDVYDCFLAMCLP